MVLYIFAWIKATDITLLSNQGLDNEEENLYVYHTTKAIVTSYFITIS